MISIKVIHEKPELIAIDEAHLICEWDGFREHYKKCETISQLFDGIPVMALTANSTSQTFHFLCSYDVISEQIQYISSCTCTNAVSRNQKDPVNPSVKTTATSMNFADQVATMVKNECSV